MWPCSTQLVIISISIYISFHWNMRELRMWPCSTRLVICILMHKLCFTKLVTDGLPIWHLSLLFPCLILLNIRLNQNLVLHLHILPILKGVFKKIEIQDGQVGGWLDVRPTQPNWNWVGAGTKLGKSLSKVFLANRTEKGAPPRGIENGRGFDKLQINLVLKVYSTVDKFSIYITIYPCASQDSPSDNICEQGFHYISLDYFSSSHPSS